MIMLRSKPGIRTSAVVGLVLSTLAAAALAGCGTNGGDGGTTASGKDAIKVVSIPIVNDAPLYIGAEHGEFKAQGLQVTTAPFQGDTAAVSAVVNGENQFGFTSMPSMISACAKGLPIKIVAPSDTSAGRPADRDPSAIITTPKSGINSAADLTGKKVGIDSLGGISEITVRSAIDRAGGKSAEVKFVELPMPSMVAALEQGQVDAVALAEPFTAQAEAKGLKVIAHHETEGLGDAVISGYFTSAELAQKNPSLIRSFRKAILAANSYANANPKAVQEQIMKMANVSAQVAQATLYDPYQDSPVTQAEINNWKQLMVKYGLLDAHADLSKCLA